MITHCVLYYKYYTLCVKLHIVCKITHNMWNRITQRFLSRSVWKKFPSLEKFYTNAVGGVGDNYEVCSNVVL